MAFKTSDLAGMAYSGADVGHNFYFFANSGGDSTATVQASGYFDDAADQIGDDDLIYDVQNAEFMQMVNTSGTITVGKTSAFV